MVNHCKLRAAIGYNCDHRREIERLIARQYRLDATGGFSLMLPMADMQQMSAKDYHANFQIG
jgi:hypothetical protein